MQVGGLGKCKDSNLVVLGPLLTINPTRSTISPSSGGKMVSWGKCRFTGPAESPGIVHAEDHPGLALGRHTADKN